MLPAAPADLDATGGAAGSTHTGLKLHANLTYGLSKAVQLELTALLATQHTWVCQDVVAR